MTNSHLLIVVLPIQRTPKSQASQNSETNIKSGGFLIIDLFFLFILYFFKPLDCTQAFFTVKIKNVFVIKGAVILTYRISPETGANKNALNLSRL